MSIDFAEIRTLDEFVELRDEWNDLVERSCDLPFMTHQWIATWWKYFAKNEQPCVIIARQDGRLVLAIPLTESTRGLLRVRCLRSMTNSHSFRFAVLADRELPHLIAAAWQYLQQRGGWDMLMLTNVPLELEIHHQFVSHVRSHGGLADIWYAAESAYIRCDGSWKDHEAKISKSVRKRLRNQRNRLERDGDVWLEVLTDPADISLALPAAFAIESLGWKGEKGSAIACDQDRLGFYTELSELTSRSGWMRLSFLRVGEDRAAFEYALEFKNRFYSIKIGYDCDKFANSSVGRLLVQDAIQRCFDGHIEEYDFIGPVTEAHAEWKPDRRSIGWIFIYRNTLRGYLHYKWKFSLIPLVKGLLRR